MVDFEIFVLELYWRKVNNCQYTCQPFTMSIQVKESASKSLHDVLWPMGNLFLSLCLFIVFSFFFF